MFCSCLVFSSKSVHASLRYFLITRVRKIERSPNCVYLGAVKYNGKFHCASLAEKRTSGVRHSAAGILPGSRVRTRKNFTRSRMRDVSAEQSRAQGCVLALVSVPA